MKKLIIGLLTATTLIQATAAMAQAAPSDCSILNSKRDELKQKNDALDKGNEANEKILAALNDQKGDRNRSLIIGVPTTVIGAITTLSSLIGDGEPSQKDGITFLISAAVTVGSIAWITVEQVKVEHIKSELRSNKELVNELKAEIAEDQAVIDALAKKLQCE